MSNLVITAQLVETGHPFGGDFTARIKRLEADFKATAARAAKTSEAATRRRVTYLRPPVPQRPGRKTTQGNMARYLTWNVTGTYEVSFDIQKANKDVPYWVIQEVGTGHSAMVKYAGSPNRRGRQARGQSTQKVIPSQVGRKIPSALAFGTAARGTYTAFGKGSGQGLYLRRNLKGAPVFRGKGAGSVVTISKEIEGKHFVRDGAKEGFRQYRRSMLAAAKSELYRPKW